MNKRKPLPEHPTERAAEIRRRKIESGRKRYEQDKRIMEENRAISDNLDLIGG